jgi:hypothetical protein
MHLSVLTHHSTQLENRLFIYIKEGGGKIEGGKGEGE